MRPFCLKRSIQLVKIAASRIDAGAIRAQLLLSSTERLNPDEYPREIGAARCKQVANFYERRCVKYNGEGGMRSWSVILLVCGLLLLLGASDKQTWAQAANTESGSSVAGEARSQPASPSASTPQPPADQSSLPLTFARETGDLDAMVKRGTIRALVLYSRTGFFYVNGKPEGIYYQALQYFQQFVNEKLHPRQPIQVVFIPVRPDQLEGALTQGVGDLIAYGLVENTARSQQVAFSPPNSDRGEADRRHRKRFRSGFIAGRPRRKEDLRQSTHCLLRESGKDQRLAAKTRQAADFG